MDIADIPEKVVLPFAGDAVPPYVRDIPTDSQIGIQDGAASLATGFPPLTFQPETSGGVGPWGEDMNGVLLLISAWSRWQSAGAPVFYDTVFANDAKVNGYPRFAMVAAVATPGMFWLNLVDGNKTDPDAGGVGWTQFPPAVTQVALAPGAAPLQSVFPQVSDNLVLSNDVANATRDINVSIGTVRDASNVTNMVLAGVMAKRMDQSWTAGGVVGSPVGCLDSGSAKLASKTYHVYMIGKLGLVPISRSRTSNVANTDDRCARSRGRRHGAHFRGWIRL